MTARERIKLYIENEGISKYQFYKEIGVANGFLDKNGHIGSDKCEKISYRYPKLSLDWLITGKGKMLKDESIVSEPLPEYETEKNIDYKLLLQEKDRQINRLMTMLEKAQETISLLSENIKGAAPVMKAKEYTANK